MTTTAKKAATTAPVAPQNPYEFTRAEYNELVKKTPNPHVSKRSEYEEIELVEDCTLYDLYRQPRAPVTDPRATKTLPVLVLNAELTCPICLGVISSTMVVMECLHRFCGECITKSLRVGTKKECPSCRVHIPSKRSLRRDENFDALIAKIYPDLAAFEEDEAKLIEELNRSRHFNNAITESAKAGAQQQEKIRRLGGKRKATDDVALADSSATATANGHQSSRNARSSTSTHTADASPSSDSTSHSEDESIAHMKRKRSAETAAIVTAAAAARSRPSSTSSSTPPSSSLPVVTVQIRVELHPEETASAPKLVTNVFATPTPLKIASLKRQIAKFLQLSSTTNMKVVLPHKNCTLSGLSRATEGAAKAKSQSQNKSGSLASGTAAPSTSVIRKDLLFDQELEDFVTIDAIYTQYKMGTDWQLLLYYHFSDTIVNGVARFREAGNA